MLHSSSSILHNYSTVHVTLSLQYVVIVIICLFILMTFIHLSIIMLQFQILSCNYIACVVVQVNMCLLLLLNAIDRIRCDMDFRLSLRIVMTYMCDVCYVVWTVGYPGINAWSYFQCMQYINYVIMSEHSVATFTNVVCFTHALVHSSNYEAIDDILNHAIK